MAAAAIGGDAAVGFPNECGWPIACTARGAMSGVVQDVTELLAWQLANELRLVALELARRPHIATHRRYCARLTRSAAAAPQHIADGFGGPTPDAFAERVRVAKAWEHDLLGLFVQARQRGLVDDKESGEYEFLARRAIASASGLIRYLENEELRTKN